MKLTIKGMGTNIPKTNSMVIRLAYLMLERGKCSGGRIHSEVVACRQYLVIAGCVFGDILVQEVDRALH